MLIGLYQPGREPWLVRYQVVVLYFGAALNKLLDADWRSGQFFENLVVRLMHQPLYTYLSSRLPAMSLSWVMSWTVIVVEFSLAAAFLIRRFFAPAIWVGIAYHTTLLVLTGRSFGMFYYATLSAYLAFVNWPNTSIAIFYRANRTDRSRLQTFIKNLDFDGLFYWSRDRRMEIELEPAKSRPWAGLRLDVGGKTYGGFATLYMFAIYNPLTYFIFAILLSLPRPVSSPYRKLLALVFLLFVSPALLAPAAKMVRAWVPTKRNLSH